MSAGSIRRVDYVLDRSQFLGSSTTNDLRDNQIHTVRNDLDDSTHPSYNSANSSALQVTAARDAHGQVLINNTTDLSKGSLVINNTTDLSEGLPVINDTADLSEGVASYQRYDRPE